MLFYMGGDRNPHFSDDNGNCAPASMEMEADLERD